MFSEIKCKPNKLSKLNKSSNSNKYVDARKQITQNINCVFFFYFLKTQIKQISQTNQLNQLNQ